MSNRNKPKIKPLDQIPKKIYYSISEASEFTGVEPHVLRYWETKFSKLNPKRVGGNQRKYTRNDIELLYEIVNLLYNEGYTLDGAERKLRGGLQAIRAERENENGKSGDYEYEDFPLEAEMQEAAADVIPTEDNTQNEDQPPEPLPAVQVSTLSDIKQELLEILNLLKD